MKRFIAFMLAALTLFAGCNILKFPARESEPAAPSSEAKEQQAPESPRPESSASETEHAPDEAAEELLSNISNLDDAKIEALAKEYLSLEQVPDEYYSIIKPIAERVTYKVGNYRIDGDTAAVDVSVSSVDVQSALNKVIPGAIAHLAALQITGKDVSNPEKILAEYAAKNIEWDKLTTIKTDATLYLIKGADGEWKADVSNPDNLAFANAVSGGAIEVAQNLKELADRFR